MNLTPDEIRTILLSYHLSNQAMAKQLGTCSREAVRSVRMGINYRDVHPEIPRWHRKRAATAEHNCKRCQHWQRSECSLGFPDPKEDGLGFAFDCCCYSPDRSQSISAA